MSSFQLLFLMISSENAPGLFAGLFAVISVGCSLNLSIFGFVENSRQFGTIFQRKW